MAVNLTLNEHSRQTASAAVCEQQTGAGHRSSARSLWAAAERSGTSLTSEDQQDPLRTKSTSYPSSVPGYGLMCEFWAWSLFIMHQRGEFLEDIKPVMMHFINHLDLSDRNSSSPQLCIFQHGHKRYSERGCGSPSFSKILIYIWTDLQIPPNKSCVITCHSDGWKPQRIETHEEEEKAPLTTIFLFFCFVRLSCSLVVSLKVSFMRRFEQHIRLKSPHGWYDADSGLWDLWPNRDPLWSKCLNVLSYFCCNEGTSKGFRTQHVARPALNQKLFVPALKGWHVVLKACWSLISLRRLLFCVIVFSMQINCNIPALVVR